MLRKLGLMTNSQRPIRVLMVTNIYPKVSNPGHGAFVKSQIDSIAREGVEVDVLSIDAMASRWNYIKAWKKIFLASLSGRYDLIHAHYGFSGLVSRCQFILPVLVSFCGGDLLGNPTDEGGLILWSQIFALTGKLLSIVVPAVIVKSDEMASKTFRKKHVFVIPNGVDFSIFKPIPKTDARRKLGLPLNRKLILFPANPLWPRKQYQVAEAAVSLLRQKGWNVDLLAVHSQPQDVVPNFMNACDAMVLPSLWEGSPNVVKESMACGLPVVSADVGDVRKLISGCEGCHVVDRDPLVFAECLESILHSGKRTNGREWIAHLESQKVARRIIRIYRQLLR
jgi:glycosyltransferase involved in cell wall biosynthesis